MTPQQLKNSILQFAIQGKLVEQRAEEGTAEELYQQIQEEKQKLIKEGKIKKEKSLPEITEDEIPFEIPESWKWLKLGNVCQNMLVPQRDKPKEFSGNIPWCRIDDIEGKFLNGTHSNQYVSKETIESMNLKVNPIGTVISACSASIGVAAIVTTELCTNQTFIGLVCMKGLFNEYLYYYLLASFKQLKRIGSGTTIPYISQDKYKNLLIPLPPLAEQKRIVAKIEKLMNLVDEYKDSYEQLVELNKKFPSDIQKSILQYAIQGKLVEQRADEGTAEELYQQIQEEKQKLIKEGKIKKEKPLPEITEDEIPFEIPKSWKWVSFQNISRIITDYVANGSFFNLRNNVQTYKNQNYAYYVRTVDLGNRFNNNWLYVDKKSYDFLSKSKLFGGELILPNIGGSIGKVFIMPKLDLPMTLAPNSIMIDFINNVSNKFYYYMFSSNYGKLLFQKATGGSATPKFSKTDLRKMIVPLPPLAEQKRIVAKIEELISLSNQIKQ